MFYQSIYTITLSDSLLKWMISKICFNEIKARKILMKQYIKMNACLIIIKFTWILLINSFIQCLIKSKFSISKSKIKQFLMLKYKFWCNLSIAIVKIKFFTTKIKIV